MRIRNTDEWKRKIAEGMRKHHAEHPERRKEAANQIKRSMQANPEAFAKGRRAGYLKATPNLHAAPDSILKLSSRICTIYWDAKLRTQTIMIT